MTGLVAIMAVAGLLADSAPRTVEREMGGAFDAVVSATNSACTPREKSTADRLDQHFHRLDRRYGKRFGRKWSEAFIITDSAWTYCIRRDGDFRFKRRRAENALKAVSQLLKEDR